LADIWAIITGPPSVLIERLNVSSFLRVMTVRSMASGFVETQPDGLKEPVFLEHQIDDRLYTDYEPSSVLDGGHGFLDAHAIALDCKRQFLPPTLFHQGGELVPVIDRFTVHGDDLVLYLEASLLRR
jgi:hypothetical protein